MEVLDISAATPEIEYSEERDVAFFENSDDVISGVFKNGSFAIFFSHDVHKPGLALDGENGQVRKIVVKVKVG